MTAANPAEGIAVNVPAPRQETGAAPAAASGPLAGDPAILGAPCFMAGTTMLALVLINYAQGQGGALPIIIAAAGFGQIIASVWSAAIGHSAPASVFGIFGTFWLSFAILVLGLTHNWLGVTPAAALHIQISFLISWLVVIGILTLATLRLPLAFTAVFACVEAALALLVPANLNGSEALTQAAGWVALGAVAFGGLIFASSLSVATGGKPLPLGRPVVK